MSYTDIRCEAIEANLGAAAALWADCNAAGWVLDVLADSRTAAAAGHKIVPVTIDLTVCEHGNSYAAGCTACNPDR